MARMNSCRGHEFQPYFASADLGDLGKYNSSDSESGAESGSEGARSEAGGEEVLGDEVLEDVEGAFADARDRWKIDADTLKGFYLHGETSQLYGWNQARGLLYEYDRNSGQCAVIWGACSPQVNAEIWTVLPLPPTDPASLQAASTNGQQSSSDVLCMLHLTRAGSASQAQVAASQFCQRLRLGSAALDALETLSFPGQEYVIRTFCAPHNDANGALQRQVAKLHALGPSVPWAAALEAASLRVPATGAILGRCVPEVVAMCWGEGDDVAAAHCRVAYVNDKFSACDLGATEGGTWLGGRRLGCEWAPLCDGCHLEFGPLRARVELVPVAHTQTEGVGGSPSVAMEAQAAPRRGGWRNAKKTLRAAGQVLTASGVRVDPQRPYDIGDAEDVPGAQRRWGPPFAREVREVQPPPQAENSHVGGGNQLARSKPRREHVADVSQAVRAPPRAVCPAVRGAGLAFWAAPRSPVGSPSRSRSRSRSPDWIPRTPSPSPPLQ